MTTTHELYVHPNAHRVAFEGTIGQQWGYGPVLVEIKDLTGLEFELWHSGGGCWILTATTETGWILSLGDNDGPLYPLSDHHEAQREGRTETGWNIYVAPNEEAWYEGEYIACVSIEDADERKLPYLVVAALREATKARS